MSFFKTAFLIKLKQLLLNKGYVIVLLSLPIIVGILVHFSASHIDEATLKVGIYTSEASMLSQQIKEILLKDEAVHFKAYNDESQLRKAVQTGDIECGFILGEDIDSGLEVLELDEKIKLIKSPATSAQGSIREIVTAALYRCIAKDIAYNCLKNKAYIGDLDEMKDFLARQVESYYQDGELMKVQFVIQAAQKIEGKKVQKMSGVIRCAKGLIAVFLLINSILTGVKLTEERRSKFYSRLVVTENRLFVPEVALSCASVFLQLVIGMISLVVIKVCSNGLIAFDLGQEGIALSIYIMSAMCIVLTASQIIKGAHIWFSIVPFMTLSSIIFCPIVFDISQYNAALGKIGYLLVPYYYLVGKEKLIVLATLAGGAVMVYSLIFLRKRDYAAE